MLTVKTNTIVHVFSSDAYIFQLTLRSSCRTQGKSVFSQENQGILYVTIVWLSAQGPSTLTQYSLHIYLTDFCSLKEQMDQKHTL